MQFDPMHFVSKPHILTIKTRLIYMYTVRVAYYEHIGDREIMFIIKELHIMQTSLSSLIVN